MCSGASRPDVYAKRVFERLGVKSKEAYNKLFGVWQWEVMVDDKYNYEEFAVWMKKEMDKLYTAGHIRGAIWSKAE